VTAIQKSRKDIRTGIKASFRKYVFLAGMMSASIFFSCQHKTDPRMQKKEAPTRTRCYDYKEKKLRAYFEQDGGSGKNKELGTEHTIQFSKLGITDGRGGAEPLAYFCTHSGHLFWLTSDTIFIKKISRSNGRLEVSDVMRVRHTEPDEYTVPGVRVVSGDIEQNPDSDWEMIAVATLTNHGLFQAARYSRKAIVNNEPERTIYNFRYDNKLSEKDRWPEQGIASGIVRVVGREKFVVIPIGEMGKGNVRNFYFVELKGKQDDSFRSRDGTFYTMHLWEKNPDLKNVFGSSIPRYDRSSGGWVANLEAETIDGKIRKLFPILTPDEKK